MQQGGVIMDVVDAAQAAIAEEAGAVAVMALERVPADIRAAGGVARMSHPDMIQGILDCTSIPVMAKARIGHEGEARVLEAMGVDMVDESEDKLFDARSSINLFQLSLSCRLEKCNSNTSLSTALSSSFLLTMTNV